MTPAPLLLVALNALYLGFGTMGGLLQGGLPAVLRAQGLGLGAASAAYAFYLPFGLAFLWAPLVDRRRMPWATPRIGWIIAMQCVAAALLLVASFGQALPLVVMVALMLAVAAALATMDIALDALAVGLVPPALRPAAAWSSGCCRRWDGRWCSCCWPPGWW